MQYLLTQEEYDKLKRVGLTDKEFEEWEKLKDEALKDFVIKLRDLGIATHSYERPLVELIRDTMRTCNLHARNHLSVKSE